MGNCEAVHCMWWQDFCFLMLPTSLGGWALYPNRKYNFTIVLPDPELLNPKPYTPNPNLSPGPGLWNTLSGWSWPSSVGPGNVVGSLGSAWVEKFSGLSVRFRA